MKKTMKKLTALLLALTLFFCLCAQSTWAAETQAASSERATLSVQSTKTKAKIAVGSVKTKGGEKVKVPVKISDNPGIAGVALEFSLPKGMKLNGISVGKAYKDGVFTRNGKTVSWFGADNVKKNGTLFTLTVTAPKQGGTYKIKAALKDGAAANLCDENGKTVKAKFSAGTVKVSVSKTAAKLTVPTIRTVKADRGQLTVSWKKNTSGKGFELQCCTDKKFKKNVKTVKISRNSVTSRTISGLKKGKTYYVRLRSVTGSNHSDWSGVKKAKTGV